MTTAAPEGFPSGAHRGGGRLATVGEMAAMVREIIPDVQITTGGPSVPHVYLVDNSRMLADVGYEIAQLRTRLLEYVSDARREKGMARV